MGFCDSLEYITFFEQQQSNYRKKRSIEYRLQ